MQQISSSNSRFRLESHDHNGLFTAELPYNNIQYECFLGVNGASLRVDIPFRTYKNVTQANLYPGKHELWLYDSKVSDTDPIFAGPIWDMTAESGSGSINASAQCALSYLAKRYLKTLKTFSSAQAADKIISLITYVNSIRAMNLTTSKQSSNAQTSSDRFKSIDRHVIKDLIDQIAQEDDGVDYYMRVVGGVHTLFVYGGLIKPTALPMAIEYGGRMNGYSVQFNAQSIANDYEIVSDNGRFGTATDGTKQTEYNALYQQVDVGSALTSTTSLNNAAAKDIKDTKSTKVIPTITTNKLIPQVDFDFGSQFLVVVDDWYTQVSQVIRVTGWQNTISQGDESTINIYTKDTEGVT